MLSAERASLAGKTCLVTGATGGLGRATALALADRGALLVLACRDAVRGSAVRRAILMACPTARVELLPIDLASVESIRAGVTSFLIGHDRVEVLISCAAIYRRTRAVSSEGLEMMFATNHLGPFLLTYYLLDALEAGAPARVMTVTAPSTTKLDFDDLQGERRFRALKAFGASKMANLLFTYELARRLEGTGVTANAFHPGLIRTGLMAELPFPLRGLLWLVSRRPTKAATDLARLASSADLEAVTGQFFKGVKASASNAYSHDREVQRRLWDESIRLGGVV